MTPWQIVASVTIPAFIALLALIWGEVAKLRRDVLAAGIDCHQVLLEIAAHQRVAALAQPPGTRYVDSPMAPSGGVQVTQEEAEAWLERQRELMARKR